MEYKDQNTDDGAAYERLFSLEEANQLLPQLETHLRAVREAKDVLFSTHHEIQLASAHATEGGGSVVGGIYIRALQKINEQLQAIQELGVLVKDLDMGLCDFPHKLEGRVIFLCWKSGELKVMWWHDVHTGYNDRQPLLE
jgi:hypothetical protein